MLRTLTAAGDLVVYDGQLGRVLELDRDLEEVARVHAETSARFAHVVSGVQARERKPWWKFW